MTPKFDDYSLKELGLLDDLGTETFDNLTDLAANLLKAPVSLVSIIDHERQRQYFKSMHGTLSEPYHSDRSTPLTHSFCKHVARQNKPMLVTDSRIDPRLSGNGAIRDLDIVAYLGVPVHDPHHQAIGAICAIDSIPRSWTEEDVVLLESLAKCVDDAIKLKSVHRTAQNERDQKQVAQLVVQELSHRLNNLFTSIQSLISLSYKKYTDVSLYAEDLRRRIFALSHANKVSIRNDGTSSFYPDQLIRDMLQQYVETGYTLCHQDSGVAMDAKLATPLGLIINELATNALKHGAWSCQGEIIIQLEQRAAPGAVSHIRFIWQESCRGQSYRVPTKEMRGFGSRLIDLSMQQLDASGGPLWGEDGLTFEIVFPIGKPD